MLSFALIGCGAIGKRHADIITAKHRLKAVCDIRPERAGTFAQKYNCVGYENISALLEVERETDVIVIATPNGLHAQHAIAALEAKHHVVCEKPMALTTTDARNMVAAAEKNNRKLFIVKQNRYNPPVAQVKQWLDTGRLGKIFSFQLNGFWNRPVAYYQNSWHGSADMDGGILFTQFSHFIDILCWFLGEAEEVNGFAENFLHKDSIAHEDTGVVAAKMKNGSIGTIQFTVNSYQKNMEGSLTLFGEKGAVKIGGAYLNVLSYADIEGVEYKPVFTGNEMNDYGFYQGSMSNHPQVYQHVEDVLLNGKETFPSLADSVKTIEMIEKIYAVLRNGK